MLSVLSVGENNLSEKKSCSLVFMSKKTNAARQKSVQIRRAHLTQSKSEFYYLFPTDYTD